MGSLQSLPTVPHLPLDWIIIGVLFVVLLVAAFRTGARHLAAVALALPAAYALDSVIAHAAFLSSSIGQLSTSSPISQALLFIGLLVLMLVIVMRIGLSFGSESGAPIQAVLAAIGTTAILLSFWMLVPALAIFWHFGSQVQAIFAGQYLFWWLTGGYASLAAARS